MKYNYEVTEELPMKLGVTGRFAQVEKRDKNHYCYDVGHIKLPDDIFDKVRDFIETLEYDYERDEGE